MWWALFPSAAFAEGTPAPAPLEVWTCTVHDYHPGGTEVSPGHVRITLSDKELISIGTDSPTDDGGLHYQLIINNTVGAVAVNAHATTQLPSLTITGLPPREAAAMHRMLTSNLPDHLVGSYTVALDKLNGSLRTGSVTVGLDQVSSIETGECVRVQPPPETTGASTSGQSGH